MAKLPKFSELTDLQKLKDFGNSLASQAKVGEFIDRVKSGVDSFTGAKTESIEEEENTFNEQFVAISESLRQIMEHHKAQAENIRQLNQQIKKLYADIKTATAPVEKENNEDDNEPR